MKVNIRAVTDLLHSALTENGSGSFSRISAAAIVSFTLFWVTYLVFKNGQMPDLAGPTLFLSGGSGATYGVNKVANAMTKKDPADPSLGG